MPAAAVAPGACRRSSVLQAAAPRATGLPRRSPRWPARGRRRSPPRVHQARGLARREQTPGGRSSDPTSRRSLLQVAPSSGAGGNRRAAPGTELARVRSDWMPRLKMSTGCSSFGSRGTSRAGGTARLAIANRTRAVTTVAATETGCARECCETGLTVVIVQLSLVPCRLGPMPSQGALAGGCRSGGPTG